MKIPRDLKGSDLVKASSRHYHYRPVAQVGSHIILQTETPVRHRIPIPDHSPLRVGTLNAILDDILAKLR